MQLAPEPQRGRTRHNVRTMPGPRLESELEDVLIAAVQGQRPLPQVLEETPRAERFARDHAVEQSVEDERSAAQGVQVIKHGAAVAQKHQRLVWNRLAHGVVASVPLAAAVVAIPSTDD